MRVIVSCVPQTGHIQPLLPLAEALVARGDDVTVASGPDAADAVTSRGLAFRVVGPGLDAWFGALRARTRGMPGDGVEPAQVLRYFVPRLFGEIGTALMVDDLLALCRELEPSLLLFDPFVFAAPQQRNLLATLLVSRGVPMLMAGDERNRSQEGNNNAYCQDNPISWLHWSVDGSADDLTLVVRKLLSLRAAVKALRRPRFPEPGPTQPGDPVADTGLSWLNPDGIPVTSQDWDNADGHSFAVLFGDAPPALSARSCSTPIGNPWSLPCPDHRQRGGGH